MPTSGRAPAALKTWPGSLRVRRRLVPPRHAHGLALGPVCCRGQREPARAHKLRGLSVGSRSLGACLVAQHPSTATARQPPPRDAPRAGPGRTGPTPPTPRLRGARTVSPRPVAGRPVAAGRVACAVGDPCRTAPPSGARWSPSPGTPRWWPGATLSVVTFSSATHGRIGKTPPRSCVTFSCPTARPSGSASTTSASASRYSKKSTGAGELADRHRPGHPRAA